MSRNLLFAVFYSFQTGTCALFFASQGGFLDIVKELISHGAPVDLPSYVSHLECKLVFIVLECTALWRVWYVKCHFYVMLTVHTITTSFVVQCIAVAVTSWYRSIKTTALTLLDVPLLWLNLLQVRLNFAAFRGTPLILWHHRITSRHCPKLYIASVNVVD